jgi:hypothetical protein
MNNNISLYDTLKSSYGDKKSKEKLKNAGYNYDSMLSNHNQQVYYNPNENKLLYNVAGTHNLKDVGTDLYLGLGKLKDTNRYKEAKKTLGNAKNNAQTVISGHSLGASIGNYIGDKNDKKYLYNAGYTIGQKTRSNKGNTTNLRTLTDPVSILSLGAKNQKTIGIIGSVNPFKAHTRVLFFWWKKSIKMTDFVEK